MSGRRGASAGVLRAMGIGSPTASASTQGAVSAESVKCPLCGHLLRFFTDTLIGVTLEQCTGASSCPNHRPHRPRPDLSGARTGTSRGPRVRPGSTAFPIVLALVAFGAGGLVGAIGAVLAVVAIVHGFFFAGNEPDPETQPERADSPHPTGAEAHAGGRS